MKSFKFLAKATILALLASALVVSPAQATNCTSITGASLRQSDDLWIFEWDALTDTTDVAANYIFVTSGSGAQSWYNNADGYFWDGVPSSATLFLVNKFNLIDFMNEKEITSITFHVRKDNNVDRCYPLTSFTTIRLLDYPRQLTLLSPKAFITLQQ